MVAMIESEGSGLQKYNERYVVRFKEENVQKEGFVSLCMPLEAELKLMDDGPIVIPGMRMPESGHMRIHSARHEIAERVTNS